MSQPYVVDANEPEEFEAPPPFSRHARLLIDPDRTPHAPLSMGLYRYEPGQVGPAHTHATETEVYYVIRGDGVVRVGDQNVELHPGTTVCIPPGTEHETKNTGAGLLEFLGIFGPAVRFDFIKSQWKRVPNTAPKSR